jgi:hypothetical protein
MLNIIEKKSETEIYKEMSRKVKIVMLADLPYEKMLIKSFQLWHIANQMLIYVLHKAGASKKVIQTFVTFATSSSTKVNLFDFSVFIWLPKYKGAPLLKMTMKRQL